MNARRFVNHPAVRQATLGLGQMGARALAGAVDSILSDFEGAFDEGLRRVRRARTRLGSPEARRADYERHGRG